MREVVKLKVRGFISSPVTLRCILARFFMLWPHYRVSLKPKGTAMDVHFYFWIIRFFFLELSLWTKGSVPQQDNGLSVFFIWITDVSHVVWLWLESGCGLWRLWTLLHWWALYHCNSIICYNTVMMSTQTPLFGLFSLPAKSNTTSLRLFTFCVH